jgi:hypothetical protein
VLAATAACALLARAASAQPRVRSVDVLRTEAPPPEIDGVLDDPIWQGPPTMDDFHQVYPDYGAPATERTEVWLRRDANALYLGVRMHDSRPDLIIARQLLRDGYMADDDRVNLMFDTFNNRREGFFFQTNPLGTRAEASSQQGPILQTEWDAIWYCAATRDAGGWTAEIAIPFQSLPLDPDSDVWGFEVERVVRRRNERSRWANWSPNHIISEPGNTGEIRGLRGVEGAVLDAKPGFSTSYGKDRDAGLPRAARDADRDARSRGSLDVFYRPMPSVTASLTVNPDFSDAPVDLRQNNLTRFETFFPETRDFFLEDAAIFKFADLTQNGLPFYSRRIGLVDEREVALNGGLKLTGHAGHVEFGILQVQTRSEPERRCKSAPTPDEVIGCEANISQPRPEIGSQSLTVGRAKWNLGEESSIGMIFTSGDPRDEIDNSLVGADFIYRTSNLPRGGRLLADAWVMRTQSSGDVLIDSLRQPSTGSSWSIEEEELGDIHDDYAFGGRLEYPTDRISTYVTFAEFKDDFDPRLGYVNRLAIRDDDAGVLSRNRVGIRDYNAFFRYRTRPSHSWLRTIDHGFQAHLVTDLDKRLETQEITLNAIELASSVEDRFRLSYLINQEVPRPNESPYIHKDAFIPAPTDDHTGRIRYRFKQVQVLLESSGSRPVKGKLELTRGGYYDGRITRAVAAIELRPSPYLFLSLEWDQADSRLPARGVDFCSPTDPTCRLEERSLLDCEMDPANCRILRGDFTKRLVRLKLNLGFSSAVNWFNTVQYDNVTDTTSLNSRLRWELTPGREIYFVINQGWLTGAETLRAMPLSLIPRLTGHETFQPTTTQLTAKIGWTLRY